MLLIGTDFSRASAIAVLEARTLAASLGVGLRCAHIRQFHVPGRWMPTEREAAWLNAAQVEADEMSMGRGTPWVELVRLATELRARMIVVGTHGHSGFQPVGLGSTAARLALLSPIPTLLVGGRERPGDDWGAYVTHATQTRSDEE
jgi:nucleotide-binding universal stress UspA family protein